MKLSVPIKEKLLNEIKIVREKMKQESDPRNKAFYYSAIFNEIARLFNDQYDPHLQFMHLVLNVSYNSIVSRLGLLAGGDITVPFPDNFFDELDKLLAKMEEDIENDKDTYQTLERITNLAYLLSGNGYYLLQKGVTIFSQ